MTSSARPPAFLTCDTIAAVYRFASRRILLFDYDGTLTPIVKIPALATLSPYAASLLASLANCSANTVWVISGRDRSFLELHVGLLSPALGLCAEHGAFIRYPNTTSWQDLSTGEDMSWQPFVCGVFDRLAREVMGTEVERKQAATVWHYRRAFDPDLAKSRARAVAAELRRLEQGRWIYAVIEGKCVVEVRAANLGKGGVVKRILAEKAKEEHRVDFVMAVGDDQTDEDMFDALNGASLATEKRFAVKVGEESLGYSAASWYLDDPEALQDCMARLVGRGRIEHAESHVRSQRAE